MKRRQFLRTAIPASTLPVVLAGFRLKAYGQSSLLGKLAGMAVATDRVLVIVQMNGGNDGLNTVIPLDQYSALSAARANIVLTESKVLRLTDATGLHPVMTGMQQLYRDGHLAVVQGVSYPSPNLSHFRATDIWLTSSDSRQVLTTGWMGRYLEEEFAGYPEGYPSSEMPDPLAIQIGSVVSTGLMGHVGPMGIAIRDTQSTYTLPGGFDIPPESPAGHELSFIRQVAEQTQQYTVTVKNAAAKARNLSTLYPAAGQNTLADQMKIVAQLIAGGLKTRIYVVNIGGFDTHASQVVTGATETGSHATLLNRVSTAITAFMDDLRLLRVDHRVIGMTFSEFGRRIKSNASNGTDHGTAAPVFLFGANVQGGLVGSNPVIPPNATTSDNLAMQFDFRQVYASVLKNWLGATQAEVQSILLKDMEPLPVITYAAAATLSGEIPKDYALLQNYPNPFNPRTTIAFRLPQPSTVRLAVYDVTGREVALLYDGTMSAGAKFIEFNASSLASGTYLYRLQANDFVETRKMTVVK